MLKRAKTPCKDCENRHAECHPECEAYKEFKARMDAIRDKRNMEYKATPELSNERRRHLFKIMRGGK